MPDVNMPGGESFVRQMLYGKGYFREKLGVDVTVGWQLDTFGHHPQMPQLMKLGGYKSFWIQRGPKDANTPSEFLWEGIDGSQIPTFWLPQSYALTYGSPKDLPGFSDFMRRRFARLAPFSRGLGRVGLAGADVCEPEGARAGAGRAVQSPDQTPPSSCASPCPPISRPWWPAAPTGRSCAAISIPSSRASTAAGSN